ncbi:MAG: anti-sigma factor [Candidatus Pacebacteria bacterium]|nr:anti-sigma factor [Candidatus Paceibacterota bacterium]
MRSRGLLVIFGLVALTVAGFFFLRRYQTEAPAAPDGSLPLLPEEERQLESQLGIEIPEEGNNFGLFEPESGKVKGLVTWQSRESGTEYSILADLPDLEPGHFYQAWLNREGEMVLLGQLAQKKGGWLLDFSGKTVEAASLKVLITLEAEDDDRPEKKVLEGTF